MADAAGLPARLAREYEHFERHYALEAAQGIEPLSTFDRQRYVNPPANTIFPREYYYHLLAPLAGKDTLEIACGNGIDSSLCAFNGANHHAYDIADQSIRMTRQRAQINDVSQRVHLQNCSDFASAFPGQTFDRVLGYAALHHIPFDGLAELIYDRLRPGGVAVFAEPVVNSRALDRLRQCIPLCHATPTEDEVPLNDQDIAAFAKPFDRMVARPFQCVSRVWPYLPGSWPVTVALHRLDHYLLKLPFMRRFASVVVFGLYRDR